MLLLPDPKLRVSPPYLAVRMWLPTLRPDAVNEYGLALWAAVPSTVAPSEKVAIPVGALYAGTVSDTVRVSGTLVPKDMVAGEVVVRVEPVAARAPSSTVTLSASTTARSGLPSAL